MKLFINMIVVVLAFTWISGVSADKGRKKQSAESFMTCASGNGDGIKAISVPAIINIDQCPPFGDVSCADCIISLENQGCKLIKVVVTHLMNPEIGTVPGTTYLLSCAKP